MLNVPEETHKSYISLPLAMEREGGPEMRGTPTLRFEVVNNQKNITPFFN